MEEDDFRKLFEIMAEICYMSSPETYEALLRRILETLKKGET